MFYLASGNGYFLGDAFTRNYCIGDPNRQIVRTVVEGTYDREFQCSFIFKGFFEAVYIFEALNGELVVFVSDL